MHLDHPLATTMASRHEDKIAYAGNQRKLGCHDKPAVFWERKRLKKQGRMAISYATRPFNADLTPLWAGQACQTQRRRQTPRPMRPKPSSTKVPGSGTLLGNTVGVTGWAMTSPVRLRVRVKFFQLAEAPTSASDRSSI